MGAYRPSGVLTSAELAERFGRTEAWVLERTGMATRRVASPDETVVGMAAEAVRDALRTCPVAPEDVGLLVLASCSVPERTGTAEAVASRAGLRHAGALTLNAACAGFSYGLSFAADAVRSGSAGHAVVVGAERMTALVDPEDLATSVLFGDGAGAAIVGPAAAADIGPVVWASDGSRRSLITVDAASGYLRMQGQAVFRWATGAVHPLALEACRRAGVQPADLAAIVPHQANLRIVDSLAVKIGASHAVVARDGERSGNTSAASIPLALCRLLEEGAVRTGELALLVGFGAGLTLAAQVVRVP